jgi:hypothetical protein
MIDHNAAIEDERGKCTVALTTWFRALIKSEVAAADVEALLRGAGQLEVLRNRSSSDVMPWIPEEE